MHGRTTLDFNDGWRFHRLMQNNGLSEAAIELNTYDDSEWEAVTLPHTWNNIDGADGLSGVGEESEGYYRGLGGYRKSYCFSSEKYDGRRIFLEFEGANTVTELYINEKPAGKHKGGYSAFRFDITEFVELDSDNMITVKVNNAPTDYIAPITDQGDFTKMGGIYRDVKLISVDPVHIDLMDHGSSGIYVTPLNITDTSADINLKIMLANDTAEHKNVTVSAQVLDDDGNAVAGDTTAVSLAAEENKQAEMSLLINNPIRWNGVENPYLYNAKITLSNGEDILDEYTQPFGIRTYYIDPEKGFFLNGGYLDLRGVNYHQDSYENGWAMTDEQRERDYAMILDMGCSSVRMAHYQHDSYEYELCDKLGLTVWTEIGIVNKISPDNDSLAISEGFAENAKQQLIELIRQNYNHPSIIVWGISNELHQMSDEIYKLYCELSTLAAEQDSTRLRTFADNQFWGQFLDMPVDVVGYNRYFGWYKDAGPAEKYGKWLDLYRHEKANHPICVSEYGGGGAISQHKDNIDWENEIDPWGERHYENYQSALHEDIWAQFSTRQYLWGKYIWCMFDFASDGRNEGDTKGQNDKGLATRERIPKDSYYFYKSVWNDEPMVHLTEQRFTERPCKVPVLKAYSNAESVELFVNGVSCGKVTRADLDPLYSTVFKWENVYITPNEKNTITVKAITQNGKIIEDGTVWSGIKL